MKRIPVRLFVKHHDYTLFVGPWVARLILNLSPRSGFSWYEGQSQLTVFVRRFWSGWSRWDREVN